MTDFKNKTIIITGASKGIGEATAKHFGSLGANLVLAARTTKALQRVATEINDQGGNALSVPCDVSKLHDVQAMMRIAQEEFGSIHVLINNAGTIEPIAKIADSDPEAWSNIADINYKGVYYGLRTAIPVMLENEGGTIINISSGAATSALEGWSHYCSTKAAVLMLTRCAHKEYGDQNIHTIGLSPGTVATHMQTAIKNSGINPVSKLDWSAHIPAEWVAQAIAFLCGPEGHEFAGTDFSLKSAEGRKRANLPTI